jgi:KDO2-lipid IV(A) lauroyltransferase
MSGVLDAKTVTRSFAGVSFRVAVWMFRFLPYACVIPLARVLATVVCRLLPAKERTALANLEHVYGDRLSVDQRKRLYRRAFLNLSMAGFETMYAFDHGPKVNQFFSVDGRHYVDEALADGNGALVVMGHFGNFTMMVVHFAFLGYRTNAIIRHLRDQHFDEYVDRRRFEHGVTSIFSVPERKCMMTAIEALRKNELVFVPFDQNFGHTNCVFVNFFNRPAATSPGPAIMARRTGARVLLMYALRNEDHTHTIHVRPLMDARAVSSQSTLELTQNMTTALEEVIYKHPDHWAWMHKRWKTQPLTETSSASDTKEN